MSLTGKGPLGQKVPKMQVWNGLTGREYIGIVKELPCAVCGRPGPSDAHHVCHERYSGRRVSDFDTIPLCKAHHQDGPEAIHNGKKSWREKFGPDYNYINETREKVRAKKGY